MTWEDLIAQTGRVLTGNTASFRAPRSPHAVRSAVRPPLRTQTQTHTAVPSDAEAQRALELPEADLLRLITTLAKHAGWHVYHTHDSRHSEAGFPDLVLAKPGTAGKAGRLIFAEVKSRKGKVSQEQMIWLDILQHSLLSLEVYLWRPADWPDIVAILTRKYYE